jgi:CRP-like cAMP-binding protein
LEIFGIWLTRIAQWEPPSAMRQAAPAARQQYRLQIAERRGKILGELSIAGSILTTIAKMTDSEAVMSLLRKVPLFANLKDEEKVCIEETEEWRLPAGEMLLKEGEPAEYFFVLLEGEMSAWKKHADQEIVVARGRPGAFFGEVPLLLGTPYMMSARAECDCRLIVFPHEAFWKLVRLCPAISGEIFRTMVTRFRNIEGSAQQQQKLEALGTMSAGLAHELNNPSSAAQRVASHLGEVIRSNRLPIDCTTRLSMSTGIV